MVPTPVARTFEGRRPISAPASKPYRFQKARTALTSSIGWGHYVPQPPAHRHFSADSPSPGTTTGPRRTGRGTTCGSRRTAWCGTPWYCPTLPGPRCESPLRATPSSLSRGWSPTGCGTTAIEHVRSNRKPPACCWGVPDCVGSFRSCPGLSSATVGTVGYTGNCESLHVHAPF